MKRHLEYSNKEHHTYPNMSMKRHLELATSRNKEHHTYPNMSMKRHLELATKSIIHTLT